MKLLARWRHSLTRYLAATDPGVKRLTASANRAIERASLIREASKAEEFMADELELQYSNLRQRMNDLLEIRHAELACYQPERAQAFAESNSARAETPAQFKERLWELELALEDRGWVREVTLSNLEFSRLGIHQLTRICRIYALKNPIIKRAAIICRLYVFGRGIEIRSDDNAANEEIKDFLDRNKAEMAHTGLAGKEQDIQTDGSLYFGLATDPQGKVTVAMIDPLEVMDIATDPNNPSRPWYFYRMWNQSVLNVDSGINENQPRKCWYPSLELVNGLKDQSIPPTFKYKSIGQVDVNWAMPVLRSRDSETPSSWRWAVPPLYAMLDWARAYKDFLEDWATIQRALARFSLMVETKGGQAAIAAYQALLSTTFADANGTQIERNPPPNVGSAHISGPGTQIQPFKTANTQTAPEQARRLLLMSAAAAGVPETFFGDASTGSLATAQSLDRPTELKFTEIQRRWMEVITAIIQYQLDVAAVTPGNKLKEARNRNPAPQPIHIEVRFPNVVEHDINNMIQAIIWISTLGGRTGIAAGIVDRRTIAKLLLQEIGYEKPDELLDDIYGKDYKPANDVTDQRSQPAPQMLSQPLGKALTDLSTPPPLPPPPAPVMPAPAPGAPPVPKPKPGMPAPSKESLRERIVRLNSILED